MCVCVCVSVCSYYWRLNLVRLYKELLCDLKIWESPRPPYHAYVCVHTVFLLVYPCSDNVTNDYYVLLVLGYLLYFSNLLYFVFL